MVEQDSVSRPARIDGRAWWLALALVVIVTVAMRAHFFGNPIVDADEEFYLLAGDRLLHGTLPYVGIWDRKPVGLFVLFAGIRLLGGDGILAYQLVATAFAAATAVLIAIIARRIATPAAAVVAALLYAPMLGLSGGQGGQTPVFYNLPVAAAVLLVLGRVAPAAAPRWPLRRLGAVAMLLIGLALQLKPNVVFEGAFLGLVLLWLAWREAPDPRARALDAAIWIGVALLPTALTFAAYVAIGHPDEWLHATFSVLARGGIGHEETVHNLVHALGRLAPLLAAIAIGAWLVPRAAHGRPATRGAHAFLAAWALVAVAGFAVFGTYFNHYVLPLLPPLLVVAAPAFTIRRRAVGPILAIVLLVGTTVWYGLYAHRLDRRKGDAAYGYAMAARIRPLLGPGRCLFVFYGEPIYYHLTDSCLSTRWPFPFHLSLTREATALGVDPVAETRRILASRPAAILDVVSNDDQVNLATRTVLRAALRRDYRLVFSYRHPVENGETDQLWQRKPDR